MRYQYVFVAEIRGLVPTKEAEIVIDVPTIGGSVTYTANRDSIPEIVDLGSALGEQLLGGLGGKAVEDRNAELKRAVRLIRQKREKPNSTETLVIVQATGNTEDFELKHTHEDDGFIVCLGDSPAKDIQKIHINHVQSLLAALHLASPHGASAKKLIECVLFYRDDGKPIFCFEIEGYATAYSTLPITQDLAEKVDRYASQLAKGKYTDVTRLLSKSMDLGNDPLLSFLSAWAALEIFVVKAFKEYEKLIFNDARVGAISAHPEVIKRMRDVMSDKFRLTDKFALIAGILASIDADADLKTFAKLKETRNNLFHGKETRIRDLPCEPTQKLVSKYLRLHLDQGR